MRVAWIQLGGAAGAAVLALLMSAPLQAADNPGATIVAAEELDKRSKQAGQTNGQSKGLSDSAVRVLMTYAFSIIPEETPGPDGAKVKVDKSDPNKFFLPNDDARQIVRAATRSAYAEVCGLIDLGQANYDTMIKSEEARNVWSREQLLMVNALHIFAVSYFTGNIKVINEPEEPAEGATTVAKGGSEGAPENAEGTTVMSAPAAPKCPPAQKEKVIKAINAYVQAGQGKQ